MFDRRTSLLSSFGLPPDSALRRAISAITRRPEPESMSALLPLARLAAPVAASARALALKLAAGVRERGRGSGRAGLVQGLLQEFALSSNEGIALMCLAEALLRIPDVATRDALIRDKISRGRWQEHLGRSPSLFVNAATWGLLLTGKLVSTHSEAGLANGLARLIGKGGEPLIRRGVDVAMRMMGEQFVAGETIREALANSRSREAAGFRYSYDMLGEAALTAADAERYRGDYVEAIHAIGRASAGRGIVEGPGISIKLSALHPRYSRAQLERVMTELYPELLELARLAKQYDIGLNIDAEESERLELSLDLLERLCHEPALASWNGLGFVVQGYQKRCPAVVDFLIDLARRSGRRLMVRLVKGAYWDSEIKRAQIDGLDGYPVYTRKPYTDVAYLACARALLAAPEQIYPQFATHNAQTLAAIHELADPVRWHPGQYEFQCLHGMGEPLYEQVVGRARLDRPCRIYAPVGTHETLLAYLVRRLLENGANSSFVNRIADPAIALETLVQDPVETVEQMALRDGRLGLPHRSIPMPRDLYGTVRRNSSGRDLSSEPVLEAIGAALEAGRAQSRIAEPMLAVDLPDDIEAAAEPVLNPADRRDVVGQVVAATLDDVEQALRSAERGAGAWAATPPLRRARILVDAADALESRCDDLIGLLMREAGKTASNAVGEVREAADFLRYYAAQVEHGFAPATHEPLGPVACISPWNFPLAIFTGQIAAALAAGNVVLAKPAEQTPLVAAEAVRVLRSAGVPRDALQLLPGPGGTIGAALVADARVQGVMFTGSTDVARLLQRSLAQRLDRHGQPVTLIAETGGQNAMVVDSSALAEQVVADVVASAFDSAGQRCSALRVLCVQDDAAGRVVAMLEGAIAELRIGAPDALDVDVGPVIDAEAKRGIETHVEAMRARGRRVLQPALRGAQALADGNFVTPTLIELDDLADLEREVFGPVLHLLRYRRAELDELLDRINGTGYGLTLGLHTRIDETIARVVDRARVGNVYVNRNMIGAVVGVQPFGGEGLSGTGPKAGGPLYLLRLLSRRPDDAALVALGDATAREDAVAAREPLLRLERWAAADGMSELAALCRRFAAITPADRSIVLCGPTGERDVYTLVPRDAVLCLATRDDDRLVQLAAALAVGCRAVWPIEAAPLRERLPEVLRASIDLLQDWTTPARAFDVALVHGAAAALLDVVARIAERPGPIVGIVALPEGERAVPLERLVVERGLSVNTAAAGGNASLMTIG